MSANFEFDYNSIYYKNEDETNEDKFDIVLCYFCARYSKLYKYKFFKGIKKNTIIQICKCYNCDCQKVYYDEKKINVE